QGVVIDKNGSVLCSRTNTRPSQLTVNFTSMGVQDIFDSLPFISPFRQHDAACDGLNISIRELNANSKAASQALKQRHIARESCLPGTDEQYATVELLAQGFCNFLHV